ncbi:hypothetical protein BV25DRAFT_1839423 [Artomyces pyxidatus]|uniref:Uncharacterized protein n=1 Tax=Artomyces pyxidatus TaxID=48021 RepID=A0ACB8SX85_9AGAM|nr:hypothetical protein BV25DRAFT_1839423 [Artomyces pyxidatus]
MFAAISSKQASGSQTHQGWLFIDSVFPVRLGTWDLRYYYGRFRQEFVLESLTELISAVHSHDFKPLSFEPHEKDGGVYVRFEYTPSDNANVLLEIEYDIRTYVQSKGGIPSSAGLRRGDVWLVKGSPWREDMNRFASPLLRVTFEGADPSEETLYNAFRPYGRILDLTPPAPVPGAPFRASTLTFEAFRSAVVARNVTHGLTLGSTRLRTAFQPPVQAHVIRDWITGHPRISIPVLVFLLGTLTYTVFDPVRAFMVEAHVLNWLNFRESRMYQWLRRNTIDRLYLKTSDADNDADAEGAWQERQEALSSLQNYLGDLPNTAAFIHGPQGSGKGRMLARLLSDKKRATLVIDCAELTRASSDMRLIDGLARQTGYWPVFTFLNSMNNLIDLASVGLIGQKAGLSSSVPDQVKQILEVVGTALRRASGTRKKQAEKMRGREAHTTEDEARRRERIELGVWSDPRMGPIAGNGIMAELGTGEEAWKQEDEDVRRVAIAEPTEMNEVGGKERDSEDSLAVASLPIVLIKNFAVGEKEEVMTVFAQWIAALVEGQVAHVIVVSDNRENSKVLAKALPSKPLQFIALYDADAGSALQFVKSRLRDANVDVAFTSEQTAYIERLGGRASDLASLIHKVRSGLTVEEAVEDIIHRGVSELRKNAFGDDAEDAKSLAWTREQAWAVLKALSKYNEVPYHDMLVNYPFKGDEAALRNMEKSELVTIGTHYGRPSVIRPGKPVYRYVFERLVSDPIFSATQELASNLKLIDAAEATVRVCEQELSTLRTIGDEGAHWWSGPDATQVRAKYLMAKLRGAQATLEKLERQNGELKKALARGG